MLLLVVVARLFAHSKALNSVMQLSIEADAQPKQQFLGKLALDNKKEDEVSENSCDCRRLNCVFSVFMFESVGRSPYAVEFLRVTDADAEADELLVSKLLTLEVVDLNCLSYSLNSLRHKFNLSIILVNSSNLLLHSTVYF